MNYIFSKADIVGMIEHWFATPPNGYLGKSYGREWQELMFKPMSEDTANMILYWMKTDIPVLKQLSDDDLMVAEEAMGFDKKRYYIVVGGDTEIAFPIQTEENILGA